MALENNFDGPVLYKPGQVLFVEGEASHFLYIIKSGEVRIFKEEKNRLVPISVVKEKDFLGELSIFSNEPRSASAIATCNTEVIMVKKSDIKKVISQCPEWVTEIMKTISDRLRHSIEVLRDHRIVDDLNLNEDQVSQQVLNTYLKSIKEYKSRRGIG